MLRTDRRGDLSAFGAACRKSGHRSAAACFRCSFTLYRRKRDLFAQKITPSSHFVKKVLGCRETTVSPTSRNGPWAVPKSFKSSYTETFSLQKCKNLRYPCAVSWPRCADTCSRFALIKHFKDRGLRATNLRSKFYFTRAAARII